MKQRGFPVPERFDVTEDMRAWAHQKGIHDEAVDRETEKFLDHGREIGRLCKDWTAAWRNWMRKYLEIREERTQYGRQPYKPNLPKRLN